jgi:hypothetical protein
MDRFVRYVLGQILCSCACTHNSRIKKGFRGNNTCSTTIYTSDGSRKASGAQNITINKALMYMQWLLSA